MIVVTGAAGFIASCLVGELNAQERGDIVVVDDFSKHEKDNNLDGKEIIAKVARSDFHNWLLEFAHEVDFVFHLGARTDTTEFDKQIFDDLNLNYSKKVWEICTKKTNPTRLCQFRCHLWIGRIGL